MNTVGFSVELTVQRKATALENTAFNWVKVKQHMIHTAEDESNHEIL